MKTKLNRLLLLFFIFCAFMNLAAAESTAVDVILSAGTAQAFTQEAVSETDINLILQAGLAATSAINQQPWFFAVITDPAVMEEIAGAGGMPMGMAMPEGFEPPEGAEMPGSSGASSGMPAGGMPAAGSGAAKAGLGDSPVAIVIYMNPGTASPNASFDCGLACQNMVIAANALGYGTKIVSSPTNALNGENHDRLCQQLGVDPALEAVAVLLVGHTDADAATSASVRNDMSEKVSFVK